MDTRGFSAYNLARGVLLNSKLTVADSGNHPLKLLDIVISGMGMDATAGLWLTPLHAIPAVPRVFPFDLIYLDKEYRVLETVEMGPGIEFPRFHAEVASALVLPPDTLRRTHTQVADRLVVCISSELEMLLAASGAISPDLAPPNRESISAMSARSAADEPGNPLTIELTPVTPAAAAVSSHRAGFEHTILTAVARVAETRETVGPSAASERVEPGQGPSIGVTDAGLKPSRKVEPAIIEHHIDPEDLFSNWVVTAPPVPAQSSSRRAAPPEPPEPAKTEKAFQDSAPEPVKQNGRKPATIKPPIEDPFQPHAASGNGASKAQAKSKPVAAAPEKAAVPAKSKTAGSAKPNPPVVQSASSQVPPATTFTAAPYGMWQVSMPTAVAPMFGAKSPAAPKAPASLNSSGGTKQAKVANPPAPETQAASPTPRSATQAADEAQPVPASITPKPQARPESAPVEPAAKEEAAAPKPMVRAQASAGIHVPGDFVASLQEKLQRAQQSKPATTPVAAVVPSQRAAAPPPSSPPPSTSSKAPAEPGLRSKPAASSVPAKPKADPSASTLRSKFKHWLNPASSPSDRRRNSRRYVPGMVAHYFTGGAPKPHDVADISMTGMYLLTDDRWMPGTMIQMTLQKPCAQGEKKQSINVLSRIVRRGSDGVAAEFVMSEALSRISHDIQPSQATDKFALARFI